MQDIDIRTDRERILIAALGAIVLEVSGQPESRPYSADSYLPAHLIDGAIQALVSCGLTRICEQGAAA